MLDERELRAADHGDVEAPPAPSPAATPTFGGRRSTRDAVELSLPGLCLRRKRLVEQRTRRRDTTRGDGLVIGLAGALGFAVSLAAGLVAQGAVSGAGELAIRTTIVLCALAVGVGAARAAAGLTRRTLERQDFARRAAVDELNSAIRVLDKRIAQAFLDHGLIGKAPIRAL